MLSVASLYKANAGGFVPAFKIRGTIVSQVYGFQSCLTSISMYEFILISRYSAYFCSVLSIFLSLFSLLSPTQTVPFRHIVVLII